jgi:hypothetical protein
MSSILSTVSQKIKAHHASVNAAYSTYYPSSSASSTPAASTTSTPRLSMDSTTPSQSPSTKSNASKAWSAVKKAAKEHHQSLNSAVDLYYGAGAPSTSSSRTSSAAASPRESLETSHGLVAAQPKVAGAQKEKKTNKAWAKVKKAAKEHHRSVNAAYDFYYAGAVVRP